jgi:hypothetical protein
MLSVAFHLLLSNVIMLSVVMLSVIMLSLLATSVSDISAPTKPVNKLQERKVL